MVALSLAPLAGLFIAQTRITNPVMTPEVFNKWYHEVHMRDLLAANFSTIGLRYGNYSMNMAPQFKNTSQSNEWIALYKVQDYTPWQDPGAWNKAPVTHSSFPDPTKPVSTWTQFNVSFWVPVQTFEGKSKAVGRPKYVLMAKIEPAEGADDDLDHWYRQQHLDMLSLLPYYRRSTRYKSLNGTQPRFLAIHEMDSVDVDEFSGNVILGTEWSKKIIGNAKVFESSSWNLLYERGDPKENL